MFDHPFLASHSVTHSIEGLGDVGDCPYLQHLPSEVDLWCDFREADRVAFAALLRELEADPYALAAFDPHPAWERDCFWLLPDGEAIAMSTPETPMVAAQVEQVHMVDSVAEAVIGCSALTANVPFPDRPGFAVSYSVAQAEHGRCHYVEANPLSIGLDCTFNLEGRQAFAAWTRAHVRGRELESDVPWSTECQVTFP